MLLDSKNIVKLADFGLATQLKRGELLKDHFGTPRYQAPEVYLRKIEYNGFEADVWTLGILLYELVCGLLNARSDFISVRILIGKGELR